jgi:ketosteroid isomerase-like protein
LRLVPPASIVNLMVQFSDESGTSGDEAALIRERLEAWARAVRARDLPGVVLHHAADIVYFDVPPPAQVFGIRRYQQSWPPFFDYIGDTGQFALDQLTVTAGSDVAFAHAVLLVRGRDERNTAQIRLTVGLRKIAGQWTVVHEHHSAPHVA